MSTEIESLRRALAEAEKERDALKNALAIKTQEWRIAEGALSMLRPVYESTAKDLRAAEERAATLEKDLADAKYTAKYASGQWQGAEERAAQAERGRDFAKSEQERIASELRIHFKMRCAAEAKADAARGMLDRLVRSYAGDGPFISDLMPEARVVLGRAEPRAAAPEALDSRALNAGGGAQGEEK